MESVGNKYLGGGAQGESRGVSGKHDGFFSECHGGRPGHD